MNPAILSPTSRFAVPGLRTGTRSPSISPDRWRYSAKSGLDPLFFNLSPTSTLQALEAPDAPLSGHDVLQDSLAAASASDRVFGIRAALAGKKLKEWHGEMRSWPWPIPPLSNGFRPLATVQQGREPLNVDCKDPNNGVATAASAQGYGDFDKEEYYGGIPKRLLQEYEDRVAAIQHEMDELEVEDLKEYVRNAHMNPLSRPEGRRIRGQEIMASDYNHLDEFTAVITATIMHALPTISRLCSLLSVWSTRLAVLRHVPGFLKLLKESQIHLETEVNMYQNMEFGGSFKDLEKIKVTFSARRSGLEAEIFELGRRLDTMLDLLEGKEDTVPEEWIDEMEALESDFSGWVAETERRLMEQSLKIHQGGRENISQSEGLEVFGRDSSALAPGSHQTLAQDQTVARKEAGDSIESQRFDGETPLPFTDTGPGGFDMPVHRLQGGPSEVTGLPQELNLSGAEALHASTILPNYIEPSSAPNDFNLREPNQKLPTQREMSTYDRQSEPKADPKPMDDETDNSTFERATLSDCSTSDEPSNDSYREGGVYTPPTRDATEDISIETKSIASVESKSNQIGSPEPREKVLGNETILPFSGGIMQIDQLVPTRTKSFSSPVYPTDFHNLEAGSSGTNINSKITASPPRPSPLIIKPTGTIYDGNASSEMSSDTSRPSSGTSEYFSNMSSPEIQHARVAEYFENPVEVITPLKSPSASLLSISRQSSQRTERGDSLTHSNGTALPPVRPISHTRRASSFAPESTIYESPRPSHESRVRPNYLSSHSRVRSASLRSFEIISRTEVRNIIISRKRNFPSDLEPRHHKSESCLTPQQLFPEPTTSKNLDDNDVDDEPVSPTEIEILPESVNGSSIQSESLIEQALPESINGSSIRSDSLIKQTPPTQSPSEGSGRSQHRFESYSDLSPGSTPAKVRQRKTAGRLGIFSSSKTATTDRPSSPLRNSDARLEARISSILTEIPGKIRLKSGPEDDAREIIPSGKSPGRKRPFLRSLATKSMRTSPGLSSPALTLTPAHTKQSTPRGQDGDSEIKLYHLHQPGKEVPIKLFVRLVGEGGERVMVRIGGGWADLGEYLKEYAIHHGRRSVSDGRFEIQGIPQSSSATPSSSLAGLPSSPISSSSRPSSSSGQPNHVSQPSSKPKRHSFGSTTPDPNYAPLTPANPPRTFHSFEPATPGSIESSISSSFPRRPSSRLSSNDDDDSPSIGLGLAGPRSRRTVVSPTKQAWVDGMIDQARKASAEKRKPSFKGTRTASGDFGDLGKVGSTKRVFLKMRGDSARGGAGVNNPGTGPNIVPGRIRLPGSSPGMASGSGPGSGPGSEHESEPE